MTNREKLFKRLEEMDNRMLSDVIDLSCSNCPARIYCENHPRAGTCQETMRKWLDGEGIGNKNE